MDTMLLRITHASKMTSAPAYIVVKTWANGGGGASALALLAGVSGAGAIATIKKKMECVQRFLKRLYGFTEYLQLGRVDN